MMDPIQLLRIEGKMSEETISTEELADKFAEPEATEEEASLNIPDKEFYVEFRVMMKPFPNEAWSEWLLYPSGASMRQMRKAVEEEAVLFVDDIEEVKDAIRVDTMLNAKFLDLPHDVLAIRQDSQQIKTDLGFGPWDKIPARHAPSIQVRLMNNDVAGKLKPKTIKDMYEDMTGLSATEDVESDGEEDSTSLED